MSETLTITLAGKDYTIQPLTLGQLEALHVGVIEPTPADPVTNARLFWKQNLETIAVALSADYPEMTAEAIGKLRIGSMRHVTKIVSDILDFSGVVTRVPGAVSGEATPGAAASTGAPSSPDSPPG